MKSFGVPGLAAPGLALFTLEIDGEVNTALRDEQHTNITRALSQHSTLALALPAHIILRIANVALGKENQPPRGMAPTAKNATPGRRRRADNQYFDVGKVGRYAHMDTHVARRSRD
jgi:hypothetical protein